MGRFCAVRRSGSAKVAPTLAEYIEMLLAHVSEPASFMVDWVWEGWAPGSEASLTLEVLVGEAWEQSGSVLVIDSAAGGGQVGDGGEGAGTYRVAAYRLGQTLGISNEVVI